MSLPLANNLIPTKVPFWSAIITQQENQVTAAAGAATYVSIQPPSGQTWLVDIAFSNSGTSGIYVYYWDYNGSTQRLHVNNLNSNPGYIIITRILTNSLYAYLEWNNTTTGGVGVPYGYSGFELSEPLYTLIRDKSNDPPLPWKRPTTLSLPSAIAGLQPYAYEFLGPDPSNPNNYVLGVLLEEDTPLAYDPVTNFPVERLTAVVSANALANIITQYKAGQLDLIKAGYGKYIDMFKKAGVI